MMVTSYGCDRWLKFTQKSTENTIQPRIHLSDPVKFSWYRLIGLESGSFLRGDYKITQRWAKVFLKALVERNSVMVEVFYMISIPKKYDQKPTILKG